MDRIEVDYADYLNLRQREERMRKALIAAAIMLEVMGVGKDNCVLMEARAALAGEKE